jgi:hypothetical protein
MTTAGPLPAFSKAILVPSWDTAKAAFPAVSDLMFADIAPPCGATGLSLVAHAVVTIVDETNKVLSMSPSGASNVPWGAPSHVRAADTR